MDFTPTDEQTAIVGAGTSTKDNLLVIARAGAAKTSTLVLLAEALQGKTILSLAFNAAIRDEMKERMPSNVVNQTIHGCGLAAWRRYIGRQTRVVKSKCYDLLRHEISLLDKKEQDEAYENFAEMLKAIGQAKNCGYIPQPLPTAFKALKTRINFFDEILRFEATDLEKELIDRVLAISFQQAREGIVDFDDMVLCPAVAGVNFDFYDIVLVDETQDLSPINHILLKKIIRMPARLIAVGDPYQAIYGFRGADQTSMVKIGAQFNCKTFYLTISFRCAQSIVENARWRAPDMKWADWAEPGLVLHSHQWDENDIPDGAAIICRNNAPLYSLAIRLLQRGRYPELLGRDITKSLVAKMKKLGKAKIGQEATLRSLEAWVATEKLRQRDTALVNDTAACMRVFIDETESLGDAIALAEKVGSQGGRIKLMTGHRSKGLEFETVFFLDRHLIQKEGQDPNIRYVIETRAEKNLIYVKSKTFGLGSMNEEEEVA